MKKIAIVLANDLFMTSKIKEVGKHLDVEIILCSNKNQLKIETEKNKLFLIILDFDDENIYPLPNIDFLKKHTEGNIQIIGYVNHMRINKIKNEFANMDFDAIMTRSEFVKKIPDILNA